MRPLMRQNMAVVTMAMVTMAGDAAAAMGVVAEGVAAAALAAVGGAPKVAAAAAPTLGRSQMQTTKPSHKTKWSQAQKFGTVNCYNIPCTVDELGWDLWLNVREWCEFIHARQWLPRACICCSLCGSVMLWK